MKRRVSELDAMPESEAAELLQSCCGSTTWVTAMLARRPFGQLELLLAAADIYWWSLPRADWLEAFSHHPRIGEREAAAPQGERSRSWSAAEQAGMNAATGDTRAELARINREYERRFGFVYLVSAAGKSADELLDTARARLSHPPSLEIEIAAQEQQKIMRLRLENLFE